MMSEQKRMELEGVLIMDQVINLQLIQVFIDSFRRFVKDIGVI
jgi:hypothetical protein